MKLWVAGVATVMMVAMAVPSHAQTPAQDVTLTGVIQGANGLPAANNVLTFTPTQSIYIPGTNSSQQVGNLSGNTVPTGSCSIANQFYTYVGPPLTLYQCISGTWQVFPGSGTGYAFNVITSGTNTQAAMLVGNGASLGYTGSGVVNANQLGGIAVSGTPAAGYLLQATGTSAATWSAPPVILPAIYQTSSVNQTVTQASGTTLAVNALTGSLCQAGGYSTCTGLSVNTPGGANLPLLLFNSSGTLLQGPNGVFSISGATGYGIVLQGTLSVDAFGQVAATSSSNDFIPFRALKSGAGSNTAKFMAGFCATDVNCGTTGHYPDFFVDNSGNVKIKTATTPSGSPPCTADGTGCPSASVLGGILSSPSGAQTITQPSGTNFNINVTESGSSGYFNVVSSSLDAMFVGNGSSNCTAETALIHECQTLTIPTGGSHGLLVANDISGVSPNGFAGIDMRDAVLTALGHHVDVQMRPYLNPGAGHTIDSVYGFEFVPTQGSGTITDMRGVDFEYPTGTVNVGTAEAITIGAGAWTYAIQSLTTAPSLFYGPLTIAYSGGAASLLTLTNSSGGQSGIYSQTNSVGYAFGAIGTGGLGACPASSFGYYNTGTGGCDLIITSTLTTVPAIAVASARKGTFTCTAAGTITIANTNETANSDVIISLHTAGGTISTPPAMKTVTAGTGFTVLCGAADTSVYNYDILN